MDWLNLLAVQGTLKSLVQHDSSKASILQCSAFFIVQLPHPYMSTRKAIALTRQTFVGKVMSLFLNMLSRLVVTFLPMRKRLLVSWLQSPSVVILEPPKISSYCQMSSGGKLSFLHLRMFSLGVKSMSVEELMLLNCGVGEDSWESLGVQGDSTSPS